MSDSVQKAMLSTETGATQVCWFNPKTLKFSRAAKWRARPGSAQGVPPLSYQGGEEERLELELLLHARYGQNGDDVKKAIDWMYDLLNPTIHVKGPPVGRKRPPQVRFSWGRFVSFAAICESVSVSEELFDVNGGPLRAWVTIQLRQAVPEPGQATPDGQNPTTRAVLANRSHTVRYGDSLASIAHEHYGDPTRWREIARDNRIDDPLRLAPGRELVIRLVAP
jgi:hypothetical protein